MKIQNGNNIQLRTYETNMSFNSEFAGLKK